MKLYNVNKWAGIPPPPWDGDADFLYAKKYPSHWHLMTCF